MYALKKVSFNCFYLCCFGQFNQNDIEVAVQTSEMGPPSSRLTTCRKGQKGPVQCDLGSSRGRGAPTTQSSDGDSSHGYMECHLAGGGKGLS